MSTHRDGAAATEVARLDKFSGFMWLVAVIAGMAFCVAVYAYWSYFWDQRKPIERLAQWGQLGDFLGGSLNPLISLFALIALLATFRVQIKELKIATGEAAIASSALEKQSVTLEGQLAHSQQQARFEGVERAAANTAARIDALLAPSHPMSGLVEELFQELDDLGWEGFDGEDIALRAGHLSHRRGEVLRHLLVIAEELNDLVWCVMEHEDAPGGEFLERYYRRRYFKLAMHLEVAGIAMHADLVPQLWSFDTAFAIGTWRLRRNRAHEIWAALEEN